jgi:hypothetical protein
MFRTLLRSAPDPAIREHVCFSCLAAGGRAQARLFSRPSLLRSDSAEKQSSQSNEKSSRGKDRPNKHTRDDSKSKTRRSRRTRAASKGKTHSRSKATSAKSIEDTFMTLSEVGLFVPGPTQLCILRLIHICFVVTDFKSPVNTEREQQECRKSDPFPRTSTKVRICSE